MIEIDLKNYIETLVGCFAYPIKIPQGVSLPAIEFKEIFNGRNPESSLNRRDLVNQKFQITLVSSDSEWLLLNKDLLLTNLDGFSGYMGDTNIFIGRVNNGISLYDNAQQNFEYNIDITFTVRQ